MFTEIILTNQNLCVESKDKQSKLFLLVLTVIYKCNALFIAQNEQRELSTKYEYSNAFVPMFLQRFEN